MNKEAKAGVLVSVILIAIMVWVYPPTIIQDFQTESQGPRALWTMERALDMVVEDNTDPHAAVILSVKDALDQIPDEEKAAFGRMLQKLGNQFKEHEIEKVRMVGISMAAEGTAIEVLCR